MNNLWTFENKEVEVFEYKGQILFNPRHVAECLEIKNVNDAIKDFNEKQKVKLTNSIIGNTDFRKLHNTGENFLTESGVYKLIFKSRKENAERFQDWVTDEVLPSIRKTGSYNSIELSEKDKAVLSVMNAQDEVSRLNALCEFQHAIEAPLIAEITYKEDVIIGLVEDIDLATKRQRITQIIRHNANGKYKERYNLLYTEFEKKYHIDLKRRIDNCDIKPKIKNKMDYIDRGMNMIPELYEIACKLFENDVNELMEEWKFILK